LWEIWWGGVCLGKKKMHRLFKIAIWLSIGFSFLIGITVFIDFRLFLTKTSVVNALEQDIFITPYGRVRSTVVTNLPLYFKYPVITNPFNKNIKVAKGDSAILYYDLDVCLLDGIIFKYNHQLYQHNANAENPDRIILTSDDLLETVNSNRNIITIPGFTDLNSFITQILMVAYAPLMLVWIVKRKRKRKTLAGASL
jgi:hypothetical protein